LFRLKQNSFKAVFISCFVSVSFQLCEQFKTEEDARQTQSRTIAAAAAAADTEQHQLYYPSSSLRSMHLLFVHPTAVQPV